MVDKGRGCVFWWHRRTGKSKTISDIFLSYFYLHVTSMSCLHVFVYSDFFFSLQLHYAYDAERSPTRITYMIVEPFDTFPLDTDVPVSSYSCIVLYHEARGKLGAA
jgi:hypothetical protein